jgi:hypothetical protein
MMKVSRLLPLIASLGLFVGVGKAQQAERRIDARALTLLKAAEAKVRAAKSLAADLDVTRTFGGPATPGATGGGASHTMQEHFSMRLLRPNFVEIISEQKVGEAAREGQPAGPARTVQVATRNDGSLRYDMRDTMCTKWTVPVMKEQRELTHFSNPLYWTFYDLGDWQFRSHVSGLWSTEFNLRDPGLRSIEYSGTETRDGVSYEVVTYTYKNAYNLPQEDPLHTTKFYIGPDTLLHYATSEGDNEKSEIRYSNLRVNDSQITPASFAFKAPANCKLDDPEKGYVTGKYADLPNGTSAPDFTIFDADNKPVLFSELIKGKKAVLLNFGGYG